MLQTVQPADIQRLINNAETFVLNIVAEWCPDCTERQVLHLDGFVSTLNEQAIDVLQMTVQVNKGEFISPEHEKLTDLFGGHGYPRTLLIKDGVVVDKDNVEVISEVALSELASSFIKQVR